MLKKLQKRIDKGITQVGWTEKKSSEIMGLRKELDKLAGQIAGTTKEEMEKSLKDAYKKGQKSANADFGLPPVVASGVVPARLMALILESNGITQNVSETVLRKTLDAYREIQAEVSAGVLTGVDTRKQAAQRMLNLLADKGITGFVDKLGRNWEMAAYTEMATRTVVAQAAIAGHIDRQVQAGRDLVLISDHAGECPLCRPWEGKVLSISGTSMEYPPLSTAKSKGLFHPNCRHTLTGYIPGLSKIGPRPNGGTPEQYEYTQKQRYNERQIRRWKRREAVAMSPQEANKSKTHIRAYQLKQRELLKEYEDKFGMTLNRRGRSERLLTGKTGIEGEGWTGVKGPEGTIKSVESTTKKSVSQQIDEATDRDTISKLINNHTGASFNISNKDTGSIPLETCKALGKELNELLNLYPVINNKSFVDVRFDRLGSKTLATADSFNRITLNKTRFKVSVKDYIEDKKSQIGWHPKGTDTLTSDISHEYGHLIHYRMEFIVSKGVEKYPELYTKAESINKWAKKTLKDPELNKLVSTYAIKNNKEALAEVFSQLRATGADTNKFTKELNDLLEDFYRP